MRHIRPLLPLILATLVLTPACRKSGGETLKVPGNIEVFPVELSFRVAGKVLERPADEGQVVQEGQLIARLDARDLEQQVALQDASAATAQAALAALLAGSRVEEIEASRAALGLAQAELNRLLPDDARIQQLHAQGILSARDAEASRAALAAARARVEQATQQFTLVKKGPRPEDLDQARARLDQARQAAGLARTQLGYATLTAPCAGLILSKNVEPREYVAPGTAVATLADLRLVWLRGYIEETELGRVKVGQKAWITTEAAPGKRFEGRVSFISPEAEFTPKIVQTRKERVKLVYRIKIEVPNPAMDLKPGMPADAEVAQESR